MMRLIFKKVILLILCFYSFVFCVFGQKKTFDAGTEFFRFTTDWIEFRRRAKRKIAENNAELKNKHSVFLSESKTGIVRLLDPATCSSDIRIHPSTTNRQFWELLEQCPKNFILGGAASYSFRNEDYTKRQKADIEIKDGLMFSTGLLNQTLFVDLGDVNLQSVSLNSKGLNYITGFIPAVIDKEATRQSQTLRNGVQADGFTYQNFLTLAENHTYILRSIAYRGEVIQILQGDIKYEHDVLKDDIRKDIIIAFRIIKMESDKSIVMLWKELDRKNSPKMKFTK